MSRPNGNAMPSTSHNDDPVSASSSADVGRGKKKKNKRKRKSQQPRPNGKGKGEGASAGAAPASLLKPEDVPSSAAPQEFVNFAAFTEYLQQVQAEEEEVERLLARAAEAARTHRAHAESLKQAVDRDAPDCPAYGVPGWIRSSDGGLKCIDEEEMALQKGVLGDLIKSAGMALLQKKNPVNISLPVRVFEPRSFLQRIPDAWCFAPVFLSRAAAASTPLERFQWTMTFIVSGLHRGSKNLKPFNPIIGETYQAHYPDGTLIFLEQISHHPPVSQFQLIGPNGIFHMHGHHEFTASFRPNSLTGAQLGPNTVEFLDGTKISYNMPNVLLKGTLMGERNFGWTDEMVFVDEKNKLKCALKFNPDQKGAISRFFSSQKTPTDTVRGEIVRMADDGNDSDAEPTVLSTCEGSWMEGIGFDGQQFWTNLEMKPFEPIPDDDPLPSDCRFREDLTHLLEGDKEEAQRWKSILEERQRADRRLRQKYEKIRKEIGKKSSGSGWW